MRNPLEVKNEIERILGVIRNPTTKAVTNYGLLGKYTFSNGFSNTAFAIGTPPPGVVKTEGLEMVLNIPDTVANHPVGDKMFTQNVYRLNIVLWRREVDSDALEAMARLERSGRFTGWRSNFIPPSASQASLPQFFATFKSFLFRDNIII